MFLRILQVVAVIALLCFAAALATPPGRLPLALRGLQRMLRKDRVGETSPSPQGETNSSASPVRRFFALVLVLLAAALAMV